MPHSINAVILKGDFDKVESEKYDLIQIKLAFDLSMFFIDGYFTACWQEKLGIEGYLETNCSNAVWYPSEKVVYELMRRISKRDDVEFTIIMTDYFGGISDQYANVYSGDRNVDLELDTISKALNYLGVEKGRHHDEFDAVGLSKYRVNPDFLDKYVDLADALGV